MKTKDQLIKYFGEVVYNTINDATLGKHRGAKNVIAPINVESFFNDGNQWMSSITISVPHFVYVTGSLEDRKFNHMSLDEYIEMQKEQGE